MAELLVVVGLGNPGPRYASTRHNAGFWVVQELADRLGRVFSKPLFGPYALVKTSTVDLSAIVEVAAESPPSPADLILVKPYTFMNRSGDIFAHLLAQHSGYDMVRVLVIVDQMDLAPGVLRLKKNCSGSTHNGLKSLMATLGTDFAPLYLGIGRPQPGVEVLDHVLGVPPPEEQAVYEVAIPRAAQAVVDWATRGLDDAIAATNSRVG